MPSKSQPKSRLGRWFRVSSWPINRRVFVIAMAPMLIVSAIVATVLTTSHIRESESALHQTGQSLASWVARSAEFFVLINDLDSLNQMLKGQGANNQIVSISIFDTSERSLSKVAFHDPVPDKALFFSAPITLSQPAASDGLENEGFGGGETLGKVVVALSQKGLIASRNQFIRKGLMVFFLGVLVSMIFAMIIAHSLIESIVRIADAVRSISEGNLKVSVDNRNEGELGVLERGVNSMVAALRESKENLESKIENATRDLHQTIGELEKKNIALDEAKEKALEASRAKEQFLAQVSHELRTPLNGIIGYGELLENMVKEPLEKRYLGIVKTAGNHLLSLINDILTFSEMRAGKRTLCAEPVEVEQVVDEVVDLNRKAASEKGLNLVVEIDTSAPLVVVADKHGLSQVISNLVSNAIKFTPSGSVVISIFRKIKDGKKSIVIRVADSGIGVPDKVRPRLFKPFSQGDGSIRKQFGGTGLGLSICYDLMQSMGGRISLTSSSDAGSVFEAELPATEAGTHPFQNSMPPFSGVFSVVTDESALCRQSLVGHLTGTGMNVQSVETVEEALAALSNHGLSSSQEVSFLIVGLSGTQAGALAPSLFSEISQRYDTKIILLIDDDAIVVDWSQQFVDCPGIAVRAKPIRRRALYQLIEAQRVLEKTAKAGSPGSSLVKSFQGVRSAVIDDNDVSRELLSIYLGNMGCPVDSYASADEFFSRFDEGAADVDAVFLDIHMPGIDGYEAARLIRQKRVASPIVLIAVTADLSFSFSEDAGRYLFDAVVYKPVTAEIVSSTMEKVFTPASNGVETAIAGILSKEMFLAEARLILDRISGHFDPLDRPAMKAELHKLNGITANLGSPQLTRLASSLEMSVITLTEEEITQAISLLDSLLSEGSPAAA